MLQCWDENPDKRGTFAELEAKLSAMALEFSPLPISKEKGVARTTSSGALETPTYLQPSIPDGYVDAESMRPGAEALYVKEADKDSDEQATYTDSVCCLTSHAHIRKFSLILIGQRYSHLDSFSQALKFAELQNVRSQSLHLLTTRPSRRLLRKPPNIPLSTAL